jgi:hypothetical protein
MTDIYYRGLSREEIVANPSKYAWNCLLYYRQFSQDELLHFRDYLEMPQLVKYQHAATLDFLRTHFSKEIDDCDMIDWLDVIRYTLNRG